MTAPMLPTEAEAKQLEGKARCDVAASVGDHFGEAALRLRAVGFPRSTAARLAAAGFDVVGWAAVQDCGVAR